MATKFFIASGMDGFRKIPKEDYIVSILFLIVRSISMPVFLCF